MSSPTTGTWYQGTGTGTGNFLGTVPGDPYRVLKHTVPSKFGPNIASQISRVTDFSRTRYGYGLRTV